MVLINCYFYIMNVEKYKIPKYLKLKPTNIKVDNETVYELIY